MKFTIKERILKYIEYKGIEKARFEKETGLSNGFIDKVGETIRSTSIDKIRNKHQDLNIDWLLSGNGTMINQKSGFIHSEEQQIPNDGTYRLVPMINSDAVGGMHKMNDISVTDPEYIIKYIPFVDATVDDVCIRVTSDSMIPTCPPGCVVQIREVSNWKEYFGYGNLFVLQLKDGRRIIKEVTKYEDNPKDYVLCISHNRTVPAEELPKNFIVSVWKVIKVLTDRGW